MSANQGGGGRYVASNVGPRSMASPERKRDEWLIGEAVTLLDKRCKALYGTDPDTSLARKTGLFLNTLRGIRKGMAQSHRTLLTQRQREICMRVLRIDVLPPLPEAELPEVLRHLPLKPPGRA